MKKAAAITVMLLCLALSAAVMCLCFAITVHAVDVKMVWEASSGATQYKIRMSVDGGRRWDAERLTVGTETEFTWVLAPEDKLLMFKVAAYDATNTAFNNWGGCWYDHRLITAETVGFPSIATLNVSGAIKFYPNESPADTYRVLFSEDFCQTWPVSIDAGAGTEYQWAAIPIDILVFSTACGTISGVEHCRPWAGAWFDKRYENELGCHIYWHYSVMNPKISP